MNKINLIEKYILKKALNEMREAIDDDIAPDLRSVAVEVANNLIRTDMEYRGENLDDTISFVYGIFEKVFLYKRVTR